MGYVLCAQQRCRGVIRAQATYIKNTRPKSPGSHDIGLDAVGTTIGDVRVRHPELDGAVLNSPRNMG